MTDTELLDTLAELNACDFGDRWEHNGYWRTAMFVNDEIRGVIDTAFNKQTRTEQRRSWAKAIALLFTHRARLLELARKGLRSGGVE